MRCLALVLLLVGCADHTCTWGEVLVEGPQLAGLVGDVSAIYWAERDAGRIVRLGREGGPGEELAVVTPYMHRLRVSGDRLYWSTSRGGVQSIATSGGTVEIEVPDDNCSALSCQTSFAVTRAAFFWTAEDSIMIRSRADGTTRSIDAPGVSSLHEIYADDDSVYWSAEKVLYRSPISGGAHVELKRFNYRRVEGLASVGSELYVVGDAKLWRVRKSDGLSTELLDAVYTGLAVDDTDIYVSDGRHVLTVPMRGPSFEILACDQIAVDYPFVDDARVVWVDQGTGEIRATPK